MVPLRWRAMRTNQLYKVNIWTQLTYPSTDKPNELYIYKQVLNTGPINWHTPWAVDCANCAMHKGPGGRGWGGVGVPGREQSLFFSKWNSVQGPNPHKKKNDNLLRHCLWATQHWSRSTDMPCEVYIYKLVQCRPSLVNVLCMLFTYKQDQHRTHCAVCSMTIANQFNSDFIEMVHLVSCTITN